MAFRSDERGGVQSQRWLMSLLKLKLLLPKVWDSTYWSLRQFGGGQNSSTARGANVAGAVAAADGRGGRREWHKKGLVVLLQLLAGVPKRGRHGGRERHGARVHTSAAGAAVAAAAAGFLMGEQSKSRAGLRCRSCCKTIGHSVDTGCVFRVGLNMAGNPMKGDMIAVPLQVLQANFECRDQRHMAARLPARRKNSDNEAAVGQKNNLPRPVDARCCAITRFGE